MRYLITVGAIVFAALTPAAAHHSDAGLDMRTVLTMEGTVKEFSLRNPHSYVVVEVTDDDGQARAWTVQMGSMITSLRRGWSRDSLAVGDQVTVNLHPATDGRPYGLMTTAEKDGAEIGTAVPRETQSGYLAAAEAPRATSIEGRWIVDRSSLPSDYPGGLDQLANQKLTLTDKGKPASTAYSQASAENPELRCITKPTPAMIVYTDLYPMEFTNNGDRTMTIRSQYFDQGDVPTAVEIRRRLG